MTDPAAPPRKSITKIVTASLIGTTIEWYDFFLYGSAAALVFNKLFFPTADPLTGTLLAFTTFAIGFMARPLGGLVFGHFGDKVGRKKLLVLSLLLMGGATFAMGLLPTYATIGVWAPLLLTLLRLVQGFALGGEWGGAVLIVSEHGDAKRRGFWASWPQCGAPGGNLLATAVLAILAGVQSDEAFLAWGWRIPFLLSGVLVLIGLWIRLSIAESPVFLEAQRKAELEKSAPAKALIIVVLRDHWRVRFRPPIVRAVDRWPEGEGGGCSDGTHPSLATVRSAVDIGSDWTGNRIWPRLGVNPGCSIRSAASSGGCTTASAPSRPTSIGSDASSCSTGSGIRRTWGRWRWRRF